MTSPGLMNRAPHWRLTELPTATDPATFDFHHWNGVRFGRSKGPRTVLESTDTEAVKIGVLENTDRVSVKTRTRAAESVLENTDVIRIREDKNKEKEAVRISRPRGERQIQVCLILPIGLQIISLSSGRLILCELAEKKLTRSCKNCGGPVRRRGAC